MRFSLNRSSLAIAAALGLSTLVACGGSDHKNNGNKTDKNNADKTLVALKKEVLETNANIAYKVYADSFDTVKTLQEKLKAFVSNPTTETLGAAKKAWIAAREPYGQSEVYRFRSGPIDALKDDGKMGAEGEGPEGRMNAWPLGEAAIDYTVNVSKDIRNDEDKTVAVEQPNIKVTSFIQDLTIEVTAANIRHTKNDEGDATGKPNRAADDRYVLQGYHAIEFLLWGQDVKDPAVNSIGGERPVTDYKVTDECTSGTTSVDKKICERRGKYLLAVTELLLKDLKMVRDAWDPENKESYFHKFVATGDVGLKKIFLGMGELTSGELKGERIEEALKNKNQEHEHSCFSDNTHRDIFTNAQGIQNVYLGKYSTVKGTSLIDYAKKASATKEAERLQAAMAQTMKDAQAISDLATHKDTKKPFDLLITEKDNPQVIALVASLEKQKKAIEALTAKLGLQ